MNINRALVASFCNRLEIQQSRFFQEFLGKYFVSFFTSQSLSS